MRHRASIIVVKLKGELIPLQISPQAAITKPKWSGYFPSCKARRGRPRQLLQGTARSFTVESAVMTHIEFMISVLHCTFCLDCQ